VCQFTWWAMRELSVRSFRWGARAYETSSPSPPHNIHGAQRVQASRVCVPVGTVLVELAVYILFTPPWQWGPDRYVAYVLPPGRAKLGRAPRLPQALFAPLWWRVSSPRRAALRRSPPCPGAHGRGGPPH
jgi:hypothetical protein